MESDTDVAPSFLVAGHNRVDKVGYASPVADAPGRVFINKSQYFEGIAPETWAFTIGGYRPAEKWLKDRVHRILSYDDIAHYCRICAALAETPQVMARIDEVIESRSGWPVSL